MWVRQGRTDAWIAHTLDISIDDLTRFKREHQLEADETSALRPADPLSVPPPEFAADGDDDDEDEDEIEEEDEERPPRRREVSRSRSRSRPSRAPRAAREERPERTQREQRPAEPRAARDEDDDLEADDGPRRRRRGRRGGRRHRARRPALEATFDHGDEGYGLWLDPAVADNPVYAEHWAGHRAVTVTLDAETITIRRAPAGGAAAAAEPGDRDDRDETDDLVD
jgi:hypothetical protein